MVTLTVEDAAGNSATDPITVTMVGGVPLWIFIASFAAIIAVFVGVTLFIRRKQIKINQKTLNA